MTGDVPRFRCHRPDAVPPWAAAEARLVHFIRHGEAAHQLVAAEAAARGRPCRCPDLAADDPARADCPYRDPSLVDAPLTARGREQVRGCAARTGAEVVLTATLTRCLETARLAFEPGPPIEAQGSSAGGEREAARAARPSIVALDELRPRISAHMHSRRSPLSALRARFPGVDLGAVPAGADDDLLWRPSDEPRAAIDARTARFLRHLAARPERNLAVVTHFTTLFALFGAADEARMLGRDEARPATDPPWLECVDCGDDHPLRRHLAPGEVRTFALVPRGGAVMIDA